MLDEIKRSSAIRFFVPSLCVLWAGWICYVSGMRGFFAMDQSIVFDGGWRILQGQIPYKDFLIPFGPISMWLQALGFQILGVNYTTYVLTACVLNAVGAFMAYATFRMLAPEKLWPALTAALLTGSWLYAPMGTPYLEQTAFVGIWIAIASVVKGTHTQTPWCRSIWMAGAGLALSASLLSKTNAGGLAIPILFLMPACLPVGPQRKIIADGSALGLGLTAGLALFAAWLWTQSDPSVFQRIVLGAGGHEGRKRLFENKEFHFVLCSLFTGKGNDLIRIVIVGCYVFLVLGIALVFNPSQGRQGEISKICSASFLGVLWIAFEQLFGITSNNNGINEKPFIGLVLTCALLVASELVTFRRKIGFYEFLEPFRQKSWKLILTVTILLTSFFYLKGIRGMGNFDFALGAGLALGLFLLITRSPSPGSPSPRRLAWMGAGVAVLIFAIGTWGSYFRQAQDFFNFHTRYVRGEGIPKLQGLAWADGVNPDALPMYPTWAEMVEIWELLDKSPGGFHLLGNYTFLYALTEHPNVGPISYFFKGLTLPSRYDPQLDSDFASRVNHQDITYFVLEDPADRNGLLDEFPLVRKVLDTQYRFLKQIGIFYVYRRVGAEVAAGR
jgi:hypothetical protein